MPSPDIARALLTLYLSSQIAFLGEKACIGNVKINHVDNIIIPRQNY